MTKEAFKAFVAEKVAEANNEPVDWEGQKKDWLFHLAQLNNRVTSWLTPYITNHSVRLGQEMEPLVEENIGSYFAPMMTITIGNDLVKLVPIGTLLIGARGRVDMTGPKGVARLVIVPKNSTGPQVRVEPPPVSEWVWKLASAPPKITFVELTEESFLDALMGVVNG